MHGIGKSISRRMGKHQDGTGDGSSAKTESDEKSFPIGLDCFASPEHANIDIVFVHGLTGGREKTWTAKGCLQPWPKQLLPTRLANARILSYGYDAYVSDWKGVVSKNRVENHAKNLLSALADLRDGDDTSERPIIFVAHSLGGLVCMDMLVASRNSADAHLKIILESTRAIAFLGTPHHGSSLARWGELLAVSVGVVKQTNSDIVRVLRQDSETLARIQWDFHNLLRERNDRQLPRINITCFYEELPVLGVGEIVPMDSAILPAYEKRGIHGDHMSMTKFASPEDPGFKSVAATLTRWSKEAMSFAITKEYQIALESNLRAWVQPPDFTDNDFSKHRNKTSVRPNESARWIFEQDVFKSWESGEAGLLWVCGRPGCGKSVIASNVVKYLLERSETQIHPPTTVIYAFSTKQDETKKTSASLVRMLLWQILLSKNLPPALQREILDDYRRTSTGQVRRPNNSTDDKFAYMADLLEKYARKIPLFIVLDALDECDDPELLASFLVRPGVSDSANLRIWLSSQKVHPIARYLDDCPLKIDMEEENIRNLTNADIKLFLSKELAAMKTNAILENLDDVTEVLVSKAKGMFLWAELAVSELQGRSVPKSAKALLDRVGSLPETLVDSFEDLLKRILRPVANYGPRGNEQHRKQLLQILQWSLHAVRPLKVGELNEAMTIVSPKEGLNDEYEFADMLDISGLLHTLYPVLYVSEDTVYLMHSSFRDFVLPARNEDPDPKIVDILGSREFQSELAGQCIAYLSRPCFEDFIAFSSNTSLKRDFVLFEYATMNWITHAVNDPNTNVVLKKQLKEFLPINQAITWLENYMAYDKDGIKVLQTRLFSHGGYTGDTKWLLKILIDDVAEREERDSNSAMTEQMSIQLGSLYRYHGMAQKAVDIFQKLYRKAVAMGDSDSLRFRHAVNNLALAKSDVDTPQHLNGAKQLFEERLAIEERLRIAGEPEYTLPALNNLASVYSRLGQSSKALEIAAEHLSRTKERYGTRHVGTALSLNNYGDCCLRAGREDLAKEYLSQAYDLYTDLEGKDSLNVLLTLHNLGAAESALGNETKALRLRKDVWMKRRALLGPDHPDTLGSCNNYATSLLALDHPTEALELLQNQLITEQKLRGPAHSSTLLAQANLAQALSGLGRAKEALELERRTFKEREKQLGVSHPQTLHSMLTYARELANNYEFDQARQLLVLCLELYSKTLSLHHRNALLVMGSLSDLCDDLNRFHVAEHIAKRALDLVMVAHADNDRMVWHREITWANAARVLGNYEAAKRTLETVLRRARGKAIKDFGIVLKAMVYLSAVFRFQGYYEEALGKAEQAVGLFENEDSEEKAMRHVFLGAQEQRGYALARLGRYEEALDIFQEVHREIAAKITTSKLVKMSSQANLADAYLDVGEVKTAQDLIQPVLEARAEIRGRKHLTTSNAIAIQAKVHRAAGRYSDAKSSHLEAIAGREFAYGAGHVMTLQARYEYGKTLCESGDYEMALEVMIRLVEDERRFLRDGHPNAEQSIILLEGLCMKLGKELPAISVQASGQSSGESDTSVRLRKLYKTLAEAEAVFGSEHPETLIIQRELALARETASETDDTASLLREVLERQTKKLSATHPETIATLVELIRVTGNVESTQQIQLSQAIMDMIRGKSTKDFDLFRKIIDHSPDMSIRDDVTGYTALALAVSHNEVDLVREFLLSSIDVNAAEKDGKTLLHIAVGSGFDEIVQLLLSHGARPNILSIKEKHSPLYLAAFGGYIEIARILLEKSADPNFIETIPPLVAAAGSNHPQIVDLLLHHGANLEAVSSAGLTPFLNSIEHSHFTMMEHLHRNGANANVESTGGLKALHIACMKGSKPIVAFLVGLGANVNAPGRLRGFRPMQIAAEHGRWDIMQVLLKSGASLDSHNQNEGGWTPLTAAAWAGKAMVVDQILKVSVRTLDEPCGVDQATPLQYAASKGYLDVVDRLLAAGAAIEAVTKSGLTPLIQAVQSDQLAVMKRLLAAGADANFTIQGLTPLALTMLQQKTDMVEVLVRHPSTNVNLPIAGKIPALLLAIALLPSSIVNLLIRRGDTDINASDSKRRYYPLHLAVALGEREYVQKLLLHNADQSSRDLLGRTAIDTVDLEDDRFPMLKLEFRTPPLEIQGNAKRLIKTYAQEVHASVKSGTPKANEDIREQLETMAGAFQALNNTTDQRIALEQTIICTETDGKPVVQQNVTCVGCRSMNKIIGTMYACTKCISSMLCEACYNGHAKGNKPCKACRHRAEAFIAIPGDGWKELDAVGLVYKDNETGRGVDLDEWLMEKAAMPEDAVWTDKVVKDS